MFVNDKYPLPFNENILFLKNVLTSQAGKGFLSKTQGLIIQKKLKKLILILGQIVKYYIIFKIDNHDKLQVCVFKKLYVVIKLVSSFEFNTVPAARFYPEGPSIRLLSTFTLSREDSKYRIYFLR